MKRGPWLPAKLDYWEQEVVDNVTSGEVDPGDAEVVELRPADLLAMLSLYDGSDSDTAYFFRSLAQNAAEAVAMGRPTVKVYGNYLAVCLHDCVDPVERYELDKWDEDGLTYEHPIVKGHRAARDALARQSRESVLYFIQLQNQSVDLGLDPIR